MSTVGVLMSPIYLINFPPDVSLTWCVSVFCGLIKHADWVYVSFRLNSIWDQCMNNIVLLPA